MIVSMLIDEVGSGQRMPWLLWRILTVFISHEVLLLLRMHDGWMRNEVGQRNFSSIR